MPQTQQDVLYHDVRKEFAAARRRQTDLDGGIRRAWKMEEEKQHTSDGSESAEGT